MKKAHLILVVCLTLVGLGAGGYFAYLHYTQGREVTLACIATSFPYVLMEHKRTEMDKILEKMKLEGGDEAHGHAHGPAHGPSHDPSHDQATEEKTEKQTAKQDEESADTAENPKKYFLSEDIDKSLIGISETIQSKGPGSMPPEEMMNQLLNLEPLFKKQAPNYLAECRKLFIQIVKECGSFDEDGEQNFSCRSKYDDRVSTLLKEHIK